MRFMKTVLKSLLPTGVSMLLLLVNMSSPMAATPTDNKTLKWAGCGISKAAFMSEMVAAYEKKTGVKVELVGGGASKGIRGVANKEMDLGGTCRHVNSREVPPLVEPDER